MSLKTLNSLWNITLLLFPSCSFSGDLDGQISSFFKSPNLKTNIQLLKKKGVTGFGKLPAQTISSSDGGLDQVIARIDRKSSTLTSALNNLIQGKKNALTNLSFGSNDIQNLLDSYQHLYAEAVQNNGGFDPKDYGIDLDITEAVNANPSSLLETNVALLSPLRNFFSKRKKIEEERPSGFMDSASGNFLSFQMGWNFLFYTQENNIVPFHLNAEYHNIYSLWGHIGSTEPELNTISDVLDLYFYVPKEPEGKDLSENDPLFSEFLSLLKEKEQQSRESFFTEKNKLFRLRKSFVSFSDAEKEKAIQALESELLDR